MPPPEKDRSYEAWLEYLKVRLGLDPESFTPEALDNIIKDVMEEVDRLAKEARARDKASRN